MSLISHKFTVNKKHNRVEREVQNMKSKVLSLAMALAIALTGIVGFADVVNAANTKDEPFSFYNANTSGTTDWRDKNNSTKVYVYPKSGPNLYYTVYGRKSATGSQTGNKRSNRVVVPQGVQGSITNYVNENSENQARLKLERTAVGYVVTSGVWSPDSTKNYTIFN